jgi:hypothetical protein
MNDRLLSIDTFNDFFDVFEVLTDLEKVGYLNKGEEWIKFLHNVLKNK